MARTGIQFWDVEKAALALQGKGKVPTIDAIREILGTGSRTTIANHLKTWVDQHKGTKCIVNCWVQLPKGTKSVTL